MARILSVGPDRDLLAHRNQALAQLGHEVRGAATRADAVEAAKSQRFDVALVCNTFPPGYATDFAEELETLMPRAKIMFIPDGDTDFTVSEIEDMIRGPRFRPKAA